MVDLYKLLNEVILLEMKYFDVICFEWGYNVELLHKVTNTPILYFKYQVGKKYSDDYFHYHWLMLA